MELEQPKIAAAEMNGFLCMTDDCSAEAIIYCKTCDHMFCKTHNQEHNALQKVLKKPHQVQSKEEYENEAEEDDSQYCTNHKETPVTVACEFCYTPMCPKCIDQILTKPADNQCPSDGKERHQIRTIKQVVKKVEDDLKKLLSELQAQEMKTGDDMRERRRNYNQQQEEIRTDLEKLNEQIRELHRVLAHFEKEIRAALLLNMNSNMEAIICEREYGKYLINCREIHEKTTQFLKLKNSAIVRNQQEIKDELNLLIQYPIDSHPEGQENNPSVVFKDKPLTRPISLHSQLAQQDKHVSQVPMYLELKEDVYQPVQGTASYTICYVQDDCLVHSGYEYPITGLAFTPDVPPSDYTLNFSLYEHKSLLYLLQWVNQTYHVHFINLGNKTVEKSVIKNPGPAWHQQLAVNDEYIIITDKQSRSVKIYSTRNYNPLFDIKHSFINSYPWGLAFLDDNIIVGDHYNNQVSLMTISESPRVIWMRVELFKPTAIAICDDRQIILVASYDLQQIYILSYKGLRLSILNCESYISDIAVYDNQLAVACEPNGVKIYDIKYEEMEDEQSSSGIIGNY